VRFNLTQAIVESFKPDFSGIGPRVCDDFATEILNVQLRLCNSLGTAGQSCFARRFPDWPSLRSVFWNQRSGSSPEIASL
jgi:hypothetical protein